MRQLGENLVSLARKRTHSMYSHLPEIVMFCKFITGETTSVFHALATINGLRIIAV